MTKYGTCDIVCDRIHACTIGNGAPVSRGSLLSLTKQKEERIAVLQGINLITLYTSEKLAIVSN